MRSLKNRIFNYIFDVLTLSVKLKKMAHSVETWFYGPRVELNDKEQKWFLRDKSANLKTIKDSFKPKESSSQDHVDTCIPRDFRLLQMDVFNRMKSIIKLIDGMQNSIEKRDTITLGTKRDNIVQACHELINVVTNISLQKSERATLEEAIRRENVEILEEQLRLAKQKYDEEVKRIKHYNSLDARRQAQMCVAEQDKILNDFSKLKATIESFETEFTNRF